jgi:hypothetical protein
MPPVAGVLGEERRRQLQDDRGRAIQGAKKTMDQRGGVQKLDNRRREVNPKRMEQLKKKYEKQFFGSSAWFLHLR